MNGWPCRPPPNVAYNVFRIISLHELFLLIHVIYSVRDHVLSASCPLPSQHNSQLIKSYMRLSIHSHINNNLDASAGNGDTRGSGIIILFRYYSE